MDEPNANLDEVGESALAQAITYLKSQGSSVIITTHRPRLVSVADNLLVLRNGRQVGFGPADEMINAVRNLQVLILVRRFLKIIPKLMLTISGNRNYPRAAPLKIKGIHHEFPHE